MKKSIIASYCFRIFVVAALLFTIFFVIINSLHKARPETGTDADFIKAEAINVNHLVSNGSTLAGITWFGNGGKIGYMGSNDVHDAKNMIVNAYVDDSGNLVLIPLHGNPIIFGGE